MTNYCVAEINVSRLLYPLDDPRTSEFVAALAHVNAVADASAGFIWRLQSSSGNATDIAFEDDPLVIVNLSLWTDVESLKSFVYKAGHLDVLRKRTQWFEKPSRFPHCLWWIPQGHIPTVDEGRCRLETYWQQGPSAQAFWFHKPFPPP